MFRIGREPCNSNSITWCVCALARANIYTGRGHKALIPKHSGMMDVKVALWVLLVLFLLLSNGQHFRRLTATAVDHCVFQQWTS